MSRRGTSAQWLAGHEAASKVAAKEREDAWHAGFAAGIASVHRRGALIVLPDLWWLSGDSTMCAGALEDIPLPKRRWVRPVYVFDGEMAEDLFKEKM